MIAPGLAAWALAAAIANAGPGAVIQVPPGVHQGNFVVKADGVSLIGQPGAVLDGGGKGTVLTIRGKRVKVRNLAIAGAGTDMFANDSGIKLQGAHGALLEGLDVRRCLTGVYASEAKGIAIRSSNLEGVPGRYMADSGDGIHLFHAPDARITACTAKGFRDGFYMEFAERTTLEQSRATRSSRYGMHVMSTKGSYIRGNVFEHNTVGGVLMFSQQCEVEGNEFSHHRGPHGQGLLFKDNNDSFVRHNRLVDNTTALHIDGSNRNVLERNLIASNGWGVVLLASSADNRFVGNAFVNDDFEVAVDMGNRSNTFAGNYWGGASGLRRLQTQAGYAPVRPFAMLAMQAPDLMAFAGSPAVRAIDAAFRSVPSLLGRMVVDLTPLPRPPEGIGGKRASRVSGAPNLDASAEKAGKKG